MVGDKELREDFKDIDDRLSVLEDHMQERKDFWYKPIMTDMPSRVEQFDRMLLVNHDKKFLWKSGMWMFGIMTALSATGVSFVKFFKLF